MSCEECGERIGRNEKVVGMSRGRRITQARRVVVEFYHPECYKKVFGFDPDTLMTMTEWRKTIRGRYGLL